MRRRIAPTLVAALLATTSLASQAETLTDALVAAYQTNPTLKAQRAALRATDEGVTKATSAFLPQVTASSRQVSARVDNSLRPPPFTTPQKLLEARVDQSLFRGFQDYNLRKQAKVLVDAGRAQLVSTEQAVLLDAVTAYVDVVRDQAVLELTTNNVEVLTRQLRASQDRFRVGEITRTDVAQSEARLAGAVSTRIKAEGDLAASRARYTSVIGRSPENVVAPKELPQLPADLAAATELAIAHNPTIDTAKYNERAAAYGINQAKGALLPTVNGFVTVSRSESTFVQIGESFANVNKQKTIGAQINVPFWMGGGEYSDIRRAKQVRSQRMMEIIAADRRVRRDAETAWEQYRAANSAIKSNQSQVRANEIALDGVRQEAAVGSRTTLDVLDAEQETLDARVNLVRAQRDQVVAAYALISSIGGLNAASLDLPVEKYDPNRNYRKVRFKPIGWDTVRE